MKNPFFEVPDIFSARRLLCVQPHPDDIDISIGGTISILAASGCEIHYLTVTDDAAGFSGASPSYAERAGIRKAEQRAAGGILGVSGYRWLDLPDAGDWSRRQARDGIIEAIREIRPDFLVTVDPFLSYEAHMDHIKTGRAAAEAAILYNFPHVAPPLQPGYEAFELTGVGFVWSNRPNTLIDIGGCSDLKFEAVAEHRSQFPVPGQVEQLKAYLSWRAAADARNENFELAEALKVLPPLMLHCFPEAADF